MPNCIIIRSSELLKMPEHSMETAAKNTFQLSWLLASPFMIKGDFSEYKLRNRE